MSGKMQERDKVHCLQRAVGISNFVIQGTLRPVWGCRNAAKPLSSANLPSSELPGMLQRKPGKLAHSSSHGNTGLYHWLNLQTSFFIFYTYFLGPYKMFPGIRVSIVMSRTLPVCLSLPPSHSQFFSCSCCCCCYWPFSPPSASLTSSPSSAWVFLAPLLLLLTVFLQCSWRNQKAPL